MSIAKESIWSFLFQLIGFLTLVLLGSITAHLLGPTDKGIFTLVTFYANFFVNLGHLTLGTIIIHHMGRGERDNREFAGSTSVILLCVSGISLFILPWSLYFGNFLYKGIDMQYILLSFFAVPFITAIYYYSSILQGMLKVTWYSAINQLAPTICLTLILIYFGLYQQLSISIVALSWFTGLVIAGMLAPYGVWRVQKSKWTVSKELIGHLIKDGAKIHIGVIATFLMTQANILIINYYLSPRDVGYYAVASSLASAVLFISLSVQPVIFPRAALASLPDAAKLTAMACRHVFGLTLLLAIAMGLSARYILLLYAGNEFLPSIPLLFILLPGFVAFAISSTFVVIWIKQRWFFLVLIISVGQAIFNITLNLFLISNYGLKGAAVATSLTYGVSAMIGIMVFKKYVNPNIMDLLIWKREDLEIYRHTFHSVFGLFKVKQ